MAEKFQHFTDNPMAPARECWVVTPSDSEELPSITKAIRAGADGTITFRTVGSAVDVAHPVMAGERIDVRVRWIRQTGTDVPVIAYA